MSRKVKFENYKSYHVLNRGIDGNPVFLDKEDYYRFVYLWYACNHGRPKINLWRKDVAKLADSILKGEEMDFLEGKHDPIVGVSTLCLMPDHFHSVILQKVDRGVSTFFQKLGTAYTKYFNWKYKKKGKLFQGPFKVAPIRDVNYLLRVSRYIHLNPLDVFQPQWREKGVKNWEKSIKFLMNYQFSSLPDYLGIRNSNLITNKDLNNLFFEGSSEENEINYLDFLIEWEKKELESLKPLILE